MGYPAGNALPKEKKFSQIPRGVEKMQLAGIMLGAVIGLLFFGQHSWGFYASILLGAFVSAASGKNAGSSRVPPASSRIPPKNEADPAQAKPPKPRYLVSPNDSAACSRGAKGHKGIFFGTILLAVGAWVFVVYAILVPPAPVKKSEIAVLVKRRSTIDAEIWDYRQCLQTKFPASKTMNVPPEIDMFCAHPWDQTTMKKLREALHQADIGFADLLPKHPEIVGMMESIPNKELVDFALIERILPLAKANEAVVKGLLSPALLEKLQIFKANVPWQDDPTKNGLRRYYLGDITLGSGPIKVLNGWRS